MEKTNKQSDCYFYFALLCIVAIKIWLVQGFDLTANDYFYDDRLYLDLSNSILKGRWLGPYFDRTLIKGPGYPLWIASSFCLGIPLLLGQQLFYSFSCLFAAYIFKPFVRWKIVLIIIFTILLFDPRSYSPRLLQVSREGIYSSLSILSLACSFGLIIYRKASLSTLLLWSTGLGIILFLFWITREEGIWVIPSLLLLTTYCLYLIWLDTPPDLWKRISITLLPYLILGLSLLSLSAINYYYYNIFCVVEFKTSSLKNAYGALTRVEHEEWNRYIHVPREVREKIYPVSPAFKELRPYLEGQIGQSWASWSTSILGKENTKGDIGGGWFMWALRQSISAAGYYKDGPTAMHFYDTIGKEINAACDKGLLKCNPKRASIIVPWHNEIIPYLWDVLVNHIKILLSYDLNKPIQIPSNVGQKGFILFSDITLEKIAQPEDKVLKMYHQDRFNKKKIQWLNSIFYIYNKFAKIIILTAGICLLINIIISIIKRKLQPLLIFSISISISILSRLIILSYIEATSFSTIIYLDPLYPLLLLVSLSIFINLARNFKSSINKDYFN